MGRFTDIVILTTVLMFNGLIAVSCKSSSKSSSIKRLDNELGSVNQNCYKELNIVEQLPVIDPQNLKPPRIAVESVPILNDDGAHTGNNEVKISVSYEQSDADGFDMPDVIYYRFCSKKTAMQTDCLSAKKGERLILDNRNDGIISNYQNVAFNPGLSEKQVFDVYAWSCVWQERATSKLGEGVVVRYPSQFGNRMLVCQKQHGQASSPYYQDKNANKNLRSLMVDNFDNEAGMKGLAYLSLTRFDRYLQETKSVKLSSEEQKIALQLENNLALGEHYGLFLTSNFEQISAEVDKKSINMVAGSEKKGFKLSVDEEDCRTNVEEELNSPITQPEDTFEGVVQPPAAPSGGLGTRQYPDEDIGKQEIVDCERRGPEFEFKEGKCWHRQDDKVTSPPSQEVEETPIDQESNETSGSLAANLGGWTLIFAGTVAGLTSVVGLSQGIKASRVSTASLVDPFFRTPPSVAGLSTESQGTGKPQTVTLPASDPGSNIGFIQRYSNLKQRISGKVHQAGVSSLQKLGSPKNLGDSRKLSKTDSKALKSAGRKLILGSVGVGLLGAAMFTLGVITKVGLNLGTETKTRNPEQTSFLKLHEDLNLFFQNFSKFTQRYKANAREIEKILK